MKNLSILFIIICLSTISCSPRRAKNLPAAEYLSSLPTPNPSNTSFSLPEIPPTPPRLVLNMKRQACFIGKCPAFSISFYADGSIQYSGEQYVDMIGNYSATINESELKILLNYAQNINYFDFENVYPVSGKIITDVPLTITYVKIDLEENYVENHHHSPLPLIRFEEHIETLVENLEWKKIQ
jgi:hypothetical protein|tara:strand:+ start:469 stop:1017 length:549 start_codon:yes stop_codon:yes gene_type:complete